MSNVAPSPYVPEDISPPGATIRDILQELNMSQAELARRMGRPANKINQIVQGDKAITADTALELENVLGMPAAFWLRREQDYRLARSERERVTLQESQSAIVKDFPYGEMARLGWVEKRTRQIDKYRELLSFFGVASADQLGRIRELAPSFRKSQLKQADPQALAAWLRRGVVEANRLETRPFDRNAVKERLDVLRTLTLVESTEMVAHLQRAGEGLGVAVVFVPHLPKTYVGGAAFWLGEKPVIELSFRYKTNDHIWFNFFHELGHILLHSPRKTWLDDFTEDEDAEEHEANAFSANTLISPRDYAQFCRSEFRSENAVTRFAKRIGIAPGIVVGRLQRDKYIPPKNLNGLKQRFDPQ